MVKKFIVLVTIMVILNVYYTESAYCHGSPGQYYVNNEPIWRGSPRLVMQHKFGKLYDIG